MAKLAKTQLQSLDYLYRSNLSAAEVVTVYSDFLCGTGLFNVYLNGSLNTSLGGGTDAGGHPGQVILTTASTSGGEGRIGLPSVYNVDLAYGTAKLETCIQLPVIATSTQEYEVNIGFTQSSKDVTNGVLFYYNSVFRGNNWQAISVNNGSFSVVDTGVAVNAGAWYRLTLICNTTYADFYINGNFITRINTNIPSSPLASIVSIAKWVGTTARVMNVDYEHFLYKFKKSR